MVALQQTAQRGNVDEIYWAASRFCTGRKLFSTRQGLLGLGPAVIREGDLCCIIFGTPVPFILRLLVRSINWWGRHTSKGL